MFSRLCRIVPNFMLVVSARLIKHTSEAPENYFLVNKFRRNFTLPAQHHLFPATNCNCSANEHEKLTSELCFASFANWRYVAANTMSTSKALGFSLQVDNEYSVFRCSSRQIRNKKNSEITAETKKNN